MFFFYDAFGSTMWLPSQVSWGLLFKIKYANGKYAAFHHPRHTFFVLFLSLGSLRITLRELFLLFQPLNGSRWRKNHCFFAVCACVLSHKAKGIADCRLLSFPCFPSLFFADCFPFCSVKFCHSTMFFFVFFASHTTTITQETEIKVSYESKACLFHKNGF